MKPAKNSCAACGAATLTWERSAGRGRLYSWTVVWRPQHPTFHVPYAPSIIELDEGFWLMSAMVGCDELETGRPRADDAVGFERGDLLGGEADLGEHLDVVLTE